MTTSPKKTDQFIQNEASKALDAAEKALGKGAGDLEKKAYAYGKGAAKVGLQLAQTNESVRDFVRSANEPASKIAGLVKSLSQGKYSTDASGTIALVNDLSGTAASFGKFLGDITQSSTVRHIAQTVAGAGGAAANCAAGIAATAPAGGYTAIAGVVSCAAGFFKLFSSLFSSPAPTPKLKIHEPRAFLAPVTQEASRVVMIDAYRLAKVLKWFYGLNTFEQVDAKLTALGDADAPVFPSAGTYLSRNGDFPVHDTSKTPAMDLRQMLYVLSPEIANFDMKGARCVPGADPQLCRQWINLHHAMFFLSRPPSPKGRSTFDRIEWDGDVPVWAIRMGAEYGRQAIRQYGRPVSVVSRDSGRVQHHLNRQSYVALPTLFEGKDIKIDWSPFIILDELINYFTMIIVQERRMGGAADPFDVLARGFPVVWRAVNVNRSATPFESGGFARNYWTNHYNDVLHGPTRRFTDAPKLQDGIPYVFGEDQERFKIAEMVTKIRQNDFEAIQQMATVRLIASFSALNMLYQRTELSTKGAEDIVGSLEQRMMGDPFDIVKSPVDPRQTRIVGGRWTLNETATKPTALIQAVDEKQRRVSGPLVRGRFDAAVGGITSVTQSTLKTLVPQTAVVTATSVFDIQKKEWTPTPSSSSSTIPLLAGAAALVYALTRK